MGGEIFSCSVIPEIEYHAILAAVPREYAQKIIDREEVALVIAEPIMFLKPCVQAIFSSDNNNFSDSNSFSVPNSIEERKKILIISTIIAFQYMIMNNGVEEIMYTKVI